MKRAMTILLGKLPPTEDAAFVCDRGRLPMTPDRVHDCIFQLSHGDRSSVHALLSPRRNVNPRLPCPKKTPLTYIILILSSEKCQNVHVNVELYGLTTFCGTRQPFSTHLCSYFLQMRTSP